MLRLLGISAGMLVAATAPAFAHLNPGEHGSFAAGFSHPMFGLDHILAMVAVGLWAAMLGGRAVWAVPSAFVGTMVIGFALALSGIALPFVEPVILASVVVLGLVVAMAVRLPAAAGAVLVGLFALFHGHAHGGEIGSATAMSYLAGFALATAALHGVGIGTGLLLGASRSRTGFALARGLGGATALAGIGLFAGVL
ncbi:HupE/UreJ family protein [Afifella sp. IM 167]|uniref:HupE/UreJ family protein n=1 Tax=Afifella sp. IM 167 TaxID=2033586 RepID=UPI001CCA5617|nr:HupE/UreJ family protein [Afifella sp. IM 167]MBZ8134028.1 protein hupE [Afifella sp. IM 167]